MKPILIAVLTILLSGCKFFGKSPEEVYRDKMENATDEELMNEILGQPLSYEVETYNYASTRPTKAGSHILNASYLHYAQRDSEFLSKEEGDKQGLESFGINSGAVVQVVFTKGSVYLEKFGRLNGSYEDGHYANSDGTVKLTFGDMPPSLNFGNADAMPPNPLDGGRFNPVRSCERIGVVHSYTTYDGYRKRKINVHYFLKSLTKPGYFHKESNQ